MTRPAITRINGGFQVAANTTKNNGLYAPQLTTAQIAAIPAATLRNGAIVYNTTTNTFQNYINNVWNNLNSSLTTVTGVGLTAGTPFIFPSGPRVPVEVAQNQVNGFVYYDVTNNVTRGWLNGAWAAL